METKEEIIKQYPKTDDCDLQTLGDLHSWQVNELKVLFESQLIALGKELLKHKKEIYKTTMSDIAVQTKEFMIPVSEIIKAFDTFGIDLNEKIDF